MNKHDKSQADHLFMRQGHYLASGSDSLTVYGLAHSNLFFADKPQRAMDHLSYKKILGEWATDKSTASSTLLRIPLRPLWKPGTRSPKKRP